MALIIARFPTITLKEVWESWSPHSGEAREIPRCHTSMTSCWHSFCEHDLKHDPPTVDMVDLLYSSAGGLNISQGAFRQGQEPGLTLGQEPLAHKSKGWMYNMEPQPPVAGVDDITGNQMFQWHCLTLPPGVTSLYQITIPDPQYQITHSRSPHTRSPYQIPIPDPPYQIPILGSTSPVGISGCNRSPAPYAVKRQLIRSGGQAW